MASSFGEGLLKGGRAGLLAAAWAARGTLYMYVIVRFALVQSEKTWKSNHRRAVMWRIEQTGRKKCSRVWTGVCIMYDD